MQIPARGENFSWCCDKELARQDKQGNESNVSVNTRYNPVFLRRWVLACFATLWISLLVGLQLLYTISQNQQGLTTTEENLRYLWVYGPTSILTIATVGWRQVDYTAKYIQPWAELAAGPAPASRTLLLDYVSPFQLISLGKAIRYGHVSVVSTILVSIMVRISTIVSTGLLGVELLPHEYQTVNMTTKTHFDVSSFDVTRVDSRASSSVYGYSKLGIPMPPGTTEHYAYQLYGPTAGLTPDSLTYNASIDVFVPTADCETGKLTYKNGLDFQSAGDGFNPENLPVASYYNTTIQLHGCTIDHGHLDAPDWYFPQNDNTPRYGYWGAVQIVNCSNLSPQDPDFHRFMISVAYSRGSSQNNNTMLNSSNVICKPSYSIRKGYVSLFVNGTVNGDISLSDSSRQLPGFNGADLGLATHRSVAQSSIDLPISQNYLTSDNWLSLMILFEGENFHLDALMDDSWLLSRWKSVYKRIAVQISRQHIMSTTSARQDTEGTLTALQLRLVVRYLPTRLLQGIAGLMFLLTILLIHSAPQNIVPKSVDSIAGTATILARSPALANTLQGTGHLGLPYLHEVLSGRWYMSSVRRTATGRSFTIDVYQRTASTRSHEDSLQIDWARPVVLRHVVMALSLILASAVLVAIELLYEYSVVHNGIISVSKDSFQRYVWVYAPTVVLVLIASSFSALNFEVEVADPYHKLIHRYTEAYTTLFWHPLRNVCVRTVYEALRNSRWALVASSISVLLAPLLAVAASGLLLPQASTDSSRVTVPIESWFNTSVSEYADLNTVVPSMVLQANMTYPQGTWDELALAKLDFGTLELATGTFGAEIPALRSRVTCETIPSQAINNLTRSQHNAVGKAMSPSIYINATVPAKCGAPFSSQYNMTWDYYGRIQTPVSTESYFGSWISGSYSMNTTVSKTQSLVCPEIYAAFGYIDVDDNITNLTLQRCALGLDSLTVNATINIETGDLLGNPTVVPESIKHFSDAPVFSGNIATAGPYLLEVNINGSNNTYDPFFETMVYGRDGIPALELLNSTTLVTQITHTFRQWSAQVVNRSLRNSLSALPNEQILSSPSITGTYTNRSRQRLVLTSTSARLLEAILLALIFCGLTVFFLFDMSRVLPKPIGTIGAIASLLADSQLIDEKSGLIPPGSEWLSDNELKKKNIWSDVRFRMGWWHKSGRCDWRDCNEGVDCRHCPDGNSGEEQVGAEKRWFGIDARFTRDVANIHESEAPAH